MKKILYGICGIGNGHIFRQLPRLSFHLNHGDKVVVFCYGRSQEVLHNLYPDRPNLHIIHIDVAYVVGNYTGLDFKQSAEKINPDGAALNFLAMSKAADLIGRPDLVFSDYEPISAQYAYAYDAPLITIDQQSKYLFETCPKDLNGTSYADEIMRLRMFFPKADLRVACSFFDVDGSDLYPELHIARPSIRDVINQMKQANVQQNKITVYVSEQQLDQEKLNELHRVVSLQPDVEFHIYGPKVVNLPGSTEKIRYYHHGDASFEQNFATSFGVITTAGHSLLSECVFLKKPVLAMPIQLYEQQMNAHVIQENKVGMSVQNLTQDNLSQFLSQLTEFSDNYAKTSCFDFCRSTEFMGQIF